MLAKVKNIIKNYRGVVVNRLAKFFRRFYMDQHQLTSVTATDRYPELFNESVLALSVHQGTNIKVLSFGCSTGEECATLHNYFPESKIVGVDINKSNLKKARLKYNNLNILFLESTAENIKREAPYHIIFCLSVLCRWEDTKGLENCAAVYPFDKFNTTIDMLTRCLRINGLIVIYNSNFRFEDTESFRYFEIVETPSIQSSGFVNKFDQFNQAIADEHRYCIYRKVSDSLSN